MNLHNDIVKSFRFRSPLFSSWKNDEQSYVSFCDCYAILWWKTSAEALAYESGTSQPMAYARLVRLEVHRSQRERGVRWTCNVTSIPMSHRVTQATAGPRFWCPSTWRTMAGLMLSPVKGWPAEKRSLGQEQQVYLHWQGLSVQAKSPITASVAWPLSHHCKNKFSANTARNPPLALPGA